MNTMQPNFRSAEALMLGAQAVWHRLFEHSPLGVLLLTPDLKIVNANEAYIREVSRSRDALASLHMFDAFPDNPHMADADGVRNLASSFEKVISEGRGHTMPLQRYDVQPDGRPWQVRFWHPKNWPVFDDRGSIAAVAHHVADATTTVLMKSSRPAKGPNAGSVELLLRNADRAILEARETIRETQETIALTRAMQGRHPSRRR